MIPRKKYTAETKKPTIETKPKHASQKTFQLHKYKIL